MGPNSRQLPVAMALLTAVTIIVLSSEAVYCQKKLLSTPEHSTPNPDGQIVNPGGQTAALIKSPRNEENFLPGPGGKGLVRLDGTDSVPAPGQNMVGYTWIIRKVPDRAVAATATGPATTLQLNPGQYFATLVIIDTAGGRSNSSVVFSVGVPGGANPVVAAVIDSPPSFVSAAARGNTTITLDGSSSTPSPGRSLIGYNWVVSTTGFPPVQVATRKGVTATVTLAVGQYRVQLKAHDSGGLESNMDKVFVVGTASASGAIAVISQPLSFVQANPALEKKTTITLDAAGSRPSPGATLTQYIWVIISLTDQEVQGNATGRLTKFQLSPGQYQVGLLVVDSSMQNVVAKKNITVGGRSSGIANLPPTIPAGLVLNGEFGKSVMFPFIRDPNGDPVTVKWEIQENGQPVESGIGRSVILQDVEAGEYQLAITATDSKGASSKGTATLRVSIRAGGAGGSEALPPFPPNLKLPLRLPVLTVAQGTLLEVDAASAGVPLADISKYTYDWTLQNSATKAVKTTQNNTQKFKYVLKEAGQYDLTLSVREKATSGGKQRRVTSVVKTLPASGLPSLTAQSSCGPFTSSSTQDTQLSCPQISATGPNSDKLQYAWRVGNIKTATIKTAGPTPTPNFGKLDLGVYVVEVAIGAKGLPQSSNTIYFLSSVLQVMGSGGVIPAPWPQNPKPCSSPCPYSYPRSAPQPPPKYSILSPFTPGKPLTSSHATAVITPATLKTSSGLAGLGYDRVRENGTGVGTSAGRTS